MTCVCLKKKWALSDRRLQLNLVWAVRMAEKPKPVIISAGMQNLELLMDDARMRLDQCLDDCVNVAHLSFRSLTLKLSRRQPA